MTHYWDNGYCFFESPEFPGGGEVFFSPLNPARQVEVQFDGPGVGTGTIGELLYVLRMVKYAVQQYRELTGFNGIIGYMADNSDGHGEKRARVFRRAFPELAFWGIC